MSGEKQKLEISEDKFNAILRRLIDHKPVPKNSVKADRKRKLPKIISRSK
jgi:hypothetical protein